MRSVEITLACVRYVEIILACVRYVEITLACVRYVEIILDCVRRAELTNRIQNGPDGSYTSLYFATVYAVVHIALYVLYVYA